MAEKEDSMIEEEHLVEIELEKKQLKEPMAVEGHSESNLTSAPEPAEQRIQDDEYGSEFANDGTGDAMDDTATIDTNSDTIEASPIPSVKSVCSGDFEEPLTPRTDLSSKSEASRSQTGSGRVTPGSQSDQSVSLSSSEKSTPNKKRRSTETAGMGRQIDFDNQQGKTHIITKGARFPFRAGIQWKKGERLEAMDFMHKWFPAKIREIDSPNQLVLIHFDGWNQRFDEWVGMASDRIRPLIRHSERKDRGKKLRGDYKIGEQVYAKWTDCKMYPAKITSVMRNGSYEVIFYDGFKKQVQPINIRPMPGELKKKTFEVNPAPAEVVKKTKIRKELIGGTTSTVTSSTEPEISTPEVQEEVPNKPKSNEKKPSSGEKGSGEKKAARSKSKKGKIIPADLFKQTNTEVDDTLSPVIKSEPVATQTAYQDKLELTVDDIKEEPVTPSGYYPEPIPQVGLPPSTSTIPATTYGVPALPPKAFVVESDHNRYKCQSEGCNKGFRKEHLLDYHIKYYHIDGSSAPPPPQPSRKRRKTTSSTESESTPSGRRSVFKQRRHWSAESVPIQDIKLEVKEEIDVSASPSQSTAPETGEISTQTTPVKGSSDLGTLEETYQLIKEELGSKHCRTQSQDSNWTEESSMTDMEGEDSLKPDELVNCICEFYEENGLMIQCEVCMCWQHAGCFGITERTLPKTYVCFVCENPPGVRESAKHIHEQDWMKSGDVPSFTYLQDQPVSEERRNIIKATNSLVTDLHHLNTVLHSLKLQLKILRTKDEQKIKMWRMDWDLMEPYDDRTDLQEDVMEGTSHAKGDNSNHNTTTTSTNIGAGHSTIISDEVKKEVDMEIVVQETVGDIKKEIDTEHSLVSQTSVSNIDEANQALDCVTGEIKEKEKKAYNADEQITDRNSLAQGSTDVTPMLVTDETGVMTGNGKSDDTGSKDQVNITDTLDVMNTSGEQAKKEAGDQKGSLEAESEEANHSDSTESAVEDPLEMCEKNLLNHIFRVQEEIGSRMDQIEEQVILLEAVEAAQSNLEAPTTQRVMSDMPQLKRCMKLMHEDLNKVKKMSVFH